MDILVFSVMSRLPFYHSEGKKLAVGKKSFQAMRNDWSMFCTLLTANEHHTALAHSR